MRYLIYSFLIFNFLIIQVTKMEAQETLIELDEKYGLIVKDRKSTTDSGDTLIYDTKTQTFSKLDGEKSFLETNQKVKYFGAFSAANQLKKNGLVVVLRTKSNQLEKLRIISRGSELSERQRANIKDKIAAIEKENAIVNKALITAFSNNYRFSEVYFIYDSSLVSLKKGVTKGIFVDKNSAIDKSITLNKTNFYICNYTLVSSSNESEGLVVYNSEMDRIKPPFPGVAVSGSSGFNMLLQLLTNNDDYYDKKIQKDVLKLQKNLDRTIKRGNSQFKKP